MRTSQSTQSLEVDRSLRDARDGFAGRIGRLIGAGFLLSVDNSFVEDAPIVLFMNSIQIIVDLHDGWSCSCYFKRTISGRHAGSIAFDSCRTEGTREPAYDSETSGRIVVWLGEAYSAADGLVLTNPVIHAAGFIPELNRDSAAVHQSCLRTAGNIQGFRSQDLVDVRKRLFSRP
jgi:hypothetical protein